MYNNYRRPKDSIWKKEKFQRTGKHHQSALKSYILQIRKHVGFMVMVPVTNQSHSKKLNWIKKSELNSDSTHLVLEE